jgi:hypothetical protein
MGKSFLDSLESEFAEASNDSGFGKDVTIVNPTDPDSPDVQTIASMAGTSDYIVTKSEVSLLMTYYQTAKFDLSLSYKALLKANRDFDMRLNSIKTALTGLNSVANRLEGVKSFTIKNEITLPKETVEMMIATVKGGIADETERAIKDIRNMLRNTTDGDWRSSGDVDTAGADVCTLDILCSRCGLMHLAQTVAIFRRTLHVGTHRVRSHCCNPHLLRPTQTPRQEGVSVVMIR